MIRIAITPAAFEAIAATPRSAASATRRSSTGRASASFGWSRPSSTASRPCAGPGESYSDVILRLVEMEAKG